METQNARTEPQPLYSGADDLILTAHFEYQNEPASPAPHGEGQHAPNGITGGITGGFGDSAAQKFALVFELTCPLMEATLVYENLTLPDGEWLSRARWTEFLAAFRARQEDELEFGDGSSICTCDGDAIFYRGGPGGKIETALAGELCNEPFERVSAELEKCENGGM
jgi:hypothetical protein